MRLNVLPNVWHREIVAIDYHHAPRYRFPTQLQDVQTALAFIRQQAAAYEIDPEHMAIMGWSAGAHLAMLAAYQPGAIATHIRPRSHCLCR
ncbi:MAG: alpha/beta hydrolase [Cyanothece sp. SIO1E1]|nr:alpha/beta hydrolase [Cyanothece sp. SIO1E1]